MKISIFLSIFLITATSEYEIQQVDKISGLVEAIEFDSYGKAYVAVVRNDDHTLYKLNTAKEILWNISIPHTVKKIIINDQNNVYLRFVSPSYKHYFSILKEDTLEKIDDIFVAVATYMDDILMYKDEEGNIIYNSYDGIKILKPNSTSPVLIKNTEHLYYYYDDHFSIDSKGNSYFGISGYEGALVKNAFAVVTKEAKQEEIPEATIYDIEEDYFVESLTVDQNGDAWVFFAGRSVDSKLSKFSNGSWTDIVTNDPYPEHQIKAVKDRVYVIAKALNDLPSPTYFLTLDGEVHKIPDLDEVPFDTYFTSTMEADKDGNTYLRSYFAYEKGPVGLMKPDQENITWIDFPLIIHNVPGMILDGSDDLWVVGEKIGLFYLRKDETVAEKVLAHGGVSTDLTGRMNFNKLTNETFALGKSGLYFVKK